MNIEKTFDFLVKNYNLSFQYQEFNNSRCLTQTYSFYNDSGCFTVQYVPVINELAFYCASRFDQERGVLCEREVDIRLIEPEIWNRHTKVWIFRRPFFWWRNKKVIDVFAEALKVHLSKSKDFFGIQV